MRMRRLLVVLVALTALLAIPAAGCAPETPSAEGGGSAVTPAEAEEPEAEEQPTAAEGETYDFVLQLSAPIGTPYGDDVKKLAADIEGASGGRITIAVKSGGEIVPSHEVTDAVSKGVIDLAQPNSGMDVGRLGPVAYLFGSSGFPGGPNPMEYFAWFYQGGGREMVNQIYQDAGYNIHVIAQITGYPAELLCHSNAEINSVDDFKGLSFRTMGPWAEVIESFGASVVTVPGGEIYEAAQRGVVDAFEYCGPGIDWTMGFHEITTHIGMPGIHSPMSSNMLIMNRDEWDALPSDLQEILRVAGEAHSLRDYLHVSTADAEALLKYKEYGTKMFVLPDDVQQAIVDRSREIALQHCAEDELYKRIFDDQMEFITMWKGRTDLLQPKYSLYTPD
ncbi:MAG TPA: hypothetical protein ENL12_01165 [Dehalococcoidia bacterium]|nr:hypothetical protein [Dehalococcoidia bacterium]